MPPWDPADGVVVKEPERPEPGYWVGCPGLLYEPRTRRFAMTYRQRRPRGKVRDRGWRCAIALSTDGVSFEDVWQVHKEDLGSASMERFAVMPRQSGGYQLYTSYVDPADGRWRIDVLEAADLDGFDVGTTRPVLTAASTGTEGVKDPCLLRVGSVTCLFASFAAPRPFTAQQRERAHSTGDIYNTGLTTHPTGLATSIDGSGFSWHGAVLSVGDASAWDCYQARLTCVLPIASSYFGCYDGSASAEGNYEERCGLAVSADLRRWRRLTPTRPWITSPHGGGSIRYLDVLTADDQWWIYYEMARADGAHELRLNRLPIGNRPEPP